VVQYPLVWAWLSQALQRLVRLHTLVSLLHSAL
jgi:hypothetical protein